MARRFRHLSGGRRPATAASWLSAAAARRWTGRRCACRASTAPLAGGLGRHLDPALKARLQAFQRAHGLRADGRPGPLTLMQLSHATGGDEPRLATESR
ncbi:MAG: peptidoglycan-binding protein [Comamonadaceae bacterium]|nr:peptidoglycan-binding protein [Comamonadaceae bacterium]